MNLPATLRESLVEQLDNIIGAYDSTADSETISGFLVEFVEAFGDEEGYDDIIDSLENSGNLDGGLPTVLETAFDGTDMDMTAEEAISIFEKLCGIEWEHDIDEKDDDTEDYTLF